MEETRKALISITDFKGSSVLVIESNEVGRGGKNYNVRVSMGRRKAKMILENIKAIELFANDATP